jgi:hypothetical protein
MSLFLDALSDAAAQMTETLASVSEAFGAGRGRGLEALLDHPAALFYLAAFAALVVFMMGGLRGAGRAGYQRGRFLTANEKSFLMTLDAALGQNYRAFAQVRLAELVSPTLGANPASRRQALNGVKIGLPLMRVKARRAYSVDELRAMCARAGLFTLPPRMEGANS